MAKITIAGKAVVVTSSMKLEELATIKKYRASALKLMGGKNNEDELFALDVGTSGTGSLGKYGAFFCDETPDAEKKACISMLLTGVQGDIKEYVADALGEGITYLNQLEAKLPDVLKEIVAQKKAIMDGITVAQ